MGLEFVSWYCLDEVQLSLLNFQQQARSLPLQNQQSQQWSESEVVGAYLQDLGSEFKWFKVDLFLRWESDGVWAKLMT